MSEKLKSAIRLDLEKDIKARLKIPRRQALPQSMKAVIKKTVDEASQTAMQSYIAKQALVQAKTAYRVADYKQAVGERLGTALVGVQLVSQSADLQKILEENAKMLFAKMKALDDAGFTKDQAFQLIVAEVSAKKAK